MILLKITGNMPYDFLVNNKMKLFLTIPITFGIIKKFAKVLPNNDDTFKYAALLGKSLTWCKLDYKI